MNTITHTPVTFKEIFVASDLSDASTGAINYAKALARHFGSHMMLVHVSEPIAPVEVPEGTWIEDTYATVAGQVEAAGEALREEGLSVSAVNAVGSIKGEIIELIKNSNADLVVLGTHGRKGVNRFILGSQAEELARRISRPVLIVGPSAGPVPSWSWAPTNIVCATSMDPERVETVSYACALAKRVESKLTIVTVTDSKHQQTHESFVEEFAKELPESAVRYVEVGSEPTDGNPATAIVDVARGSKADLVIMGAKESYWGASHLFPGILAQVLAIAHCPVLTVKGQ